MEATLDALAEAQIAHLESKQRPFVCVGYAQSIDGTIALRRGQPYPISGDASLQLTHNIRAKHAGILVGIGTVLADDPRLNVRYGQGPDPQPVIVDSRLRIPLNARVLQGSKRAWIATLQNSTEGSASSEMEGAKVLQFQPNAEGRIPIQELLKELWTNGIHTLMVEGGGEIIASFLHQALVDWIIVTIAPLFLGGYNLFNATDVQSTSQPIRLTGGGMEQLGDDLVIWGSPKWEGR